MYSQTGGGRASRPLPGGVRDGDIAGGLGLGTRDREGVTMRKRRTIFLSLGVAVLLAAGVPGCGGGDEAPREEGVVDEERARLDREMDRALEEDPADPELRDEPAGEARPGRAEEPSPPPPPPPSRPRAEPPAVAPGTAPPEPEAGQPQPEPEPPLLETVEYTAPAGVEFRVEMDDALSTRTARPGDVFTTRSIDPVTDGTTVIVTGEAPVHGHVTAVQASGGRGEAAVLKVAFDSVRVEGRWFPIAASVVEASPETAGRQTTAEKTAKIGAGALAGAILGRVVGGDARGTVIGAAVGAAAGSAIVLGTEDVDAVLPAGAVLRLRLDRPLTVAVERFGG